MPNFGDNRVAKGSFGYSVCTILIFIHVSEGQEKIKRYCLVVECRKFHQVLQKQILHRHLVQLIERSKVNFA